jgi:hypothetical protein
LRAKKLAQSCYEEMFMNCSSLKKKPELPAENLEIRCYENMFTGCDKLSE